MNAPRIGIAVAALVSSAAGQSTISPVDRYAYAANAGWVDCRPSPADGIVVSDTFLSGFAWAANIGWICFGDGSPANGHGYSNTSAGDFGVNLSPASGLLSGFAYAANTGWINFQPSQESPATDWQPRLDWQTGGLAGMAWSANLGWINLATTCGVATVSIAHPDSDGDGIADAWEKLHFAGSLDVATATSNFDSDPSTDLGEYLAGTDPRSPSSYLRILGFSITADLVSVTFTSSPDRSYRIEFDDDLAPPWSDSGHGRFAPSSYPGTITTLAFPTPFEPGPSCFLRVAAQLPLAP